MLQEKLFAKNGLERLRGVPEQVVDLLEEEHHQIEIWSAVRFSEGEAVPGASR